MENNETISVIVPVYKVEQYLDQCVESIVGQTYRDLEIILVDDGSPDGCPALCDAWAARDSRIRVIHQENMGAAAARNMGLKVAKGVLIAFVDSDDIAHPEMYERLHKAMVETQSEIVECGFAAFEWDQEVSKDIPLPDQPERFSTEEALRLHMRNTAFRQLVWNKLYKRSCITALFTEGKTIDDEFWTYKILASAQRLAKIRTQLYYYRQQADSIMHQPYSMKRLQALEAAGDRLDYIRRHFPALAGEAAAAAWGQCMYQQQMALRFLKGEELAQATEKIRKVREQAKGKDLDKVERPFKQRVWVGLSRVNFLGTCKLRNRLRIGL